MLIHTVTDFIHVYLIVIIWTTIQCETICRVSAVTYPQSANTTLHLVVVSAHQACFAFKNSTLRNTLCLPRITFVGNVVQQPRTTANHSIVANSIRLCCTRIRTRAHHLGPPQLRGRKLVLCLSREQLPAQPGSNLKRDIYSWGRKKQAPLWQTLCSWWLLLRWIRLANVHALRMFWKRFADWGMNANTRVKYAITKSVVRWYLCLPNAREYMFVFNVSESIWFS